jgi:nanoRNase/pAp phosphatase (c-di-AMP/oligoRNAs hydrolase)
MNRIKSFLSSLKGKNIALITHFGADVDSFSAAAALNEALKKKFFPVIVVPGHLNLNARKLAFNTNQKFELNSSLKKFDGAILLDFSSIEMLGNLRDEFLDFKKPVLIIDHHIPAKINAIKSRFKIIDKNASSSCNIVLNTLIKEKFLINKRIATFICCGIIADSVFFQVANEKTFSDMAFALKKSGLSIQKIFSLFSTKMDLSERIARLKAAKRVKIFGIGGFLICITDVGCFEASAANSLIRLGADVAFAGDIKKNSVLVSARASFDFINKTSFSLPEDVFFKLKNFFEGNGGGHAGAASFSGKAETIEEVLNKCLELVKEFIQSKNPNVKIKQYS